MFNAYTVTTVCLASWWGLLHWFSRLNFVCHSLRISDAEHVCWNMQIHHFFMCITFLYLQVLLNWFHVDYFLCLLVLLNIEIVLGEMHLLEICDLFYLFSCIWYDHFNFLLWTIIGLLTISKVLSYCASHIALLCRLPWMSPANWEDTDEIRRARSSTIKR